MACSNQSNSQTEPQRHAQVGGRVYSHRPSWKLRGGSSVPRGPPQPASSWKGLLGMQGRNFSIARCSASPQPFPWGAGLRIFHHAERRIAWSKGTLFSYVEARGVPVHHNAFRQHQTFHIRNGPRGTVASVPKSLDQHLGSFLRKKRGGLTCARFARKLGISPSTLYRLEQGQQRILLNSWSFRKVRHRSRRSTLAGISLAHFKRSWESRSLSFSCVVALLLHIGQLEFGNAGGFGPKAEANKLAADSDPGEVFSRWCVAAQIGKRGFLSGRLKGAMRNLGRFPMHTAGIRLQHQIVNTQDSVHP